MQNVLRALRPRTFQALAATVAVAGAGAIAASVPAVAAPASAASAALPPTMHQCKTADLSVWLGVPGNGTAGPVYFPLELTNISNSPCLLYGYPGVSAVGQNGRQLGSPASRNSAQPAHPVTLAKGATAHVRLGITDPGFFSPSACPRANAMGLRVYPPNDTASTIVSLPGPFPACGKPGPAFLSVSVVIAGVGIPGFNV